MNWFGFFDSEEAKLSASALRLLKLLDSLGIKYSYSPTFYVPTFDINAYAPVTSYGKDFPSTGAFYSMLSSSLRRQVFLPLLNVKCSPFTFSVPSVVINERFGRDSSEVRKAVRAYEIQRFLHLPTSARVIDMTAGRCTFSKAASATGLFKVTALVVYDFPGYPVEESEFSFPTIRLPFSKCNFADERLDFHGLLGSSFDLYYFNASPSYSGHRIAELSFKVALSLAVENPSATFLIRMGTNAGAIFRFASYFSQVDVVQFATCHLHDFHLVARGFRGRSGYIDASIALLLASLSEADDIVLSSLYRNIMTKFNVFDRSLVSSYTFPSPYSPYVHEHCERIIPAFSSGLRAKITAEVLRLPVFHSLFERMYSLVSVRNSFFGKTINGLTPTGLPFKVLQPTVSSSDYVVATTQSASCVPVLFQKVLDTFFSFEPNYHPPLLNQQTFVGSILLRLDVDLDPQADVNVYPELHTSALELIELFRGKVSQEIPTLTEILNQADLSSSVGFEGKKFCPGARNLAQAVSVPSFLSEVERVHHSFNSPQRSEFNMESFCFDKPHELLPPSPSKIYLGNVVPRLIVFKGGHLRLGLNFMFMRLLQAFSYVDASGRRLFEHTTCGETPPLTARRFVQASKRYKDPVFYCIDISVWDATMQMVHQMLSFMIFSALFPHYERSYANYYFHEIYKVFVAFGVFFLVLGVKSTGTEDNTLNNSLTHFLVLKSALRRAAIFNAFFVVHGDDGFVIMERSDLPAFLREKSMYNKNGMHMRKDYVVECLEDSGYSSHGYSEIIYDSKSICVELRPHFECFSKIRYIWANSGNSTLEIAKLGSYLFLYYYTLEVRLYVLAVLVESGYSFVSVSEDKHYFLSFTAHVNKIGPFLAHHYEYFEPNAFLRSFRAIRALYRRKISIDVLGLYDMVFAADRFNLHLPDRSLVVEYVNAISKAGF